MCCSCMWKNAKDQININICCRRSRYLVGFRLFASLYLLQMMISNMILGRQFLGYAFATLTAWGALLGTVNFCLLFILQFKTCKNRICPKCCWKFSHIIGTLSLSMGFVIALIFWIAIFPILIQWGILKTEIDILNQIQFHLLVLVFLIIDFFISGIEYQINHVVFIVLLGFLYLAVNAFYSLTYSPVYPIMTWKDGITVLWILVSFVLAVGSFLLFWRISRCKKRYIVLNKKESQQECQQIQKNELNNEDNLQNSFNQQGINGVRVQ